MPPLIRVGHKRIVGYFRHDLGSTVTPSGSVLRTVLSAPDTDWPEIPSGYLAPPDGSSSEQLCSATTQTGWFNSGSLTVVQDAGATHSPPNVVRARVSQGTSGGVGEHQIGKSNVLSYAWRKIWVGCHVKLASNFFGHSSGVNKIMGVGLGGTPLKGILSAQGVGDSSLSWMMRLQNLGTAHTGTQNAFGNLASGPAPRNTWQRVSFNMECGPDLGAADGVFEWWVNGTKVGRFTGIQWGATGDSSFFNGPKVDFIWGGTGGTADRDLDVFWDVVKVMGRS